MINKSTKFKKIILEHEKRGLPIPDDDKMCELLGITKERLKTIKNDYLYDTISTNTKINEDDQSSTELEDFIEDNSSQSLDFNIENRSLLTFLKKTLDPDAYYIIYYKIFAEKKLSDSEIGEIFSLSRQRIYQKAQKVLLKLKPLCTNNTVNYSNNDLTNIDNILPIEPDEVINYLFFREILTETERRVIKLYISRKYLSARDYAQELGLQVDEYQRILATCQNKMKATDHEDQLLYDSFKNAILNEYHSKILSIDLDCDLSKSAANLQIICYKWRTRDYQSAINALGSKKIKRNDNLLLMKYFNASETLFNINLRSSEKEINVLLYGLNKHKDLPKKKLFQVLKNNKPLFTDEEYDYLLMSKFGKISRKEFNDKHPHSWIDSNKRLKLETTLEKLYFNIWDYTHNVFFSREKYLNMRSQCTSKIDPFKLRLLDMYYGESPKSIKEISRITGQSYDQINDQLKKARTLVQNIYLNSSKTITFDEQIYIPYLLENVAGLNEVTHSILIDFIINHKSYDELSKIHKKSKSLISHTITEGLQKIDFYRFGILQTEAKYSQEELEEALKNPSLTGEERQIIKLCLVSNYALAYEKIGKQKVKNLMIRFYRYCYKNKIASVLITEEDIKIEVNKHISERIINEKERILLSYTYGINNELNPTGERYSREQILQNYPEFKDKYKRSHDDALDKIRASKIKLIRPTFGYMSREKLEQYLQNKKLPISAKERELLCYSFGLEGYPYKDLNDLQRTFKDSLSNIRILIQKAFSIIYKYNNHEIPEKFLFEEDILPYLKFFTKSDQGIIFDKYQNNLTVKELAKKYNLSDDQIESRLHKIAVHLKDLQKNYVNGFDFDYFWAHVDDQDLPFYGDITLAKRIFYLYFEKSLSSEEVIAALNLNCSSNKLYKIIDTLYLAILKHRSNIKKPVIFSYEEIEEYYSKNQDLMDRDHRNVYLSYFEKVSKNKEFEHYIVSNISPYILIDLLKERKEPVFDINNTSRQEVISLLNQHRNRLSSQTVQTLLTQFNITERELMSGKEQIKVLKLLAYANKEIA